MAALAGDCAVALEPLVRDADPDASRIGEVRNLCMREAESGDPDAVYRLSFFYLGLGEWNPDRAVMLMREAALNGVSEAQYWLAWQYESGPLLPDEQAPSLYWYESAADAEHPLALRRLADAYDTGGLGLRSDPGRASVLRDAAARCEN